LKEIWIACGWKLIEIDGHNFEDIINALKKFEEEKEMPVVIFAHTVKGKGISFMENKLEWHYKAPNEEERDLALKELT
jgi:transketolase